MLDAIGRIRVSTHHTLPVAITPAPIRRTRPLHAAIATSEAEPACGPGSSAVSSGTATPHAIATPSTRDRQAAMPTR